ncbi:hypothetical protein ACHQM5_014158 [Ranunculus cassubicifolius]
MSSLTTVRRVKERGGAGSKITSLKPSPNLQSSFSDTEGSTSTTTTRKSIGKENNRSISATRSSIGKSVINKPVPIPRIDKSAIQIKDEGGVSRGCVRWSTSSVPRGRSSSPSDFTRILTDRMSRVSVSDRSSGRSGERVGKSVGLERSHSQKGNSMSKSKLDENRYVDLGKVPRFMSSSKKEGNVSRVSNSNLKSSEKIFNGVRVFGKDVNVSLNSSNSGEIDVNKSKKGLLDVVSKFEVREGARNAGSNIDLTVKVAKEHALSAIKVSECFKEKVDIEEGKSAPVTKKYSSKLHEKLAFLEGKVKRIASDIRKTKEMLDMNNPDTSKTIISDIQEKISGIEKAMGNVAKDKKDIVDVPKIGDRSNQEPDVFQKTQSKHASVTDLNSEELEARLFPHHKLLRGRTSSKAPTGSQKDLLHHEEASGQLKMEAIVLSPGEHNSIALEFLDSLNKKESKVSIRIGHARLDFDEVQEMDGPSTSSEKENSDTFKDGKSDGEFRLTSDETTVEFDDDQENRPKIVIEEMEESCVDQLNEIGQKTSTGGWFVSEGESVLLAHDDGSCTFYDITNSEVKAEYKPPPAVSPNLWGDCWFVRAPDSDGCAGRYVVAASSGNTLDSGYCAWDFYTKDVKSFHVEEEPVTTSSRTVLGLLPNSGMHKRNELSAIMSQESQQWWYKPCGHLIASTASSQKVVTLYDIRDGEQVMKWESQRPVITMDYSSPLHWRNRGKAVMAEAEAITLWDVNSLSPQALLSIPTSGRKVSALHVNNTDAELGGGIRRRASSTEVEGHDGVFCTQDTINVLDFRLPSGVGLKISKIGVSVQSIFSRGDSIFLGCSDRKLAVKEQARSCIQQFSLRRGRLASTYGLPESNAHFNYSAISQVWGNSDFVMGVSGLGLFVFDASTDEGIPTEKAQEVRDIIGPADLYAPSFDYLASRILIISRDRPAMWRYLS